MTILLYSFNFMTPCIVPSICRYPNLKFPNNWYVNIEVNYCKET